MAICPRCNADLGEPMPLACVNCGMIFVKPHASEEIPAGSMPTSPEPTPTSSVKICENCKTALTPVGELNFRVGGYARGSGFLLGNWNQLAENLQPFALYHCPNCGKIQFYEPGR
jgi:hypothetical protein